MSGLESPSRTVAASAAEQALREDVRAELESHLDLCIESLVSRGLEPSAARREALRRFGDFDVIEKSCLIQKRTGERAMKIAIALLAAALALVTVGFGWSSLRMQRAALESELAAAEAAAVLERERSQPRVTILLGAADVVSPGDTVALQADVAELNLRIQVDEGGEILLPQVGRLDASGRTRDQLQAAIAEAYAPYYREKVELFVQVERDVAG